MAEKFILALDQGTTSSRAILFDKNGSIRHIAQKEFTQIYPKAGWVEHDPMEIWQSQLQVAKEVIETSHIQPSDIEAIGIITSVKQLVVWDKAIRVTLYHNAIVWQDKRTA